MQRKNRLVMPVFVVNQWVLRIKVTLKRRELLDVECCEPHESGRSPAESSVGSVICSASLQTQSIIFSPVNKVPAVEKVEAAASKPSDEARLKLNKKPSRHCRA